MYTFKAGERIVRITNWDDFRINAGTICVVVTTARLPQYLAIRVLNSSEDSHFPYHDPTDYIPETIYNSKLYKAIK